MRLGVITHYTNGVFFTVHGFTTDLFWAKARPRTTRFALAVVKIGDFHFSVTRFFAF